MDDEPPVMTIHEAMEFLYSLRRMELLLQEILDNT